MRSIGIRVLAACFLLGGVWWGVTARAEVSPADQTAIQAVIGSQIDAFASPDLQHMFGSPARFMDMVQRQYRPVYRPRTMQFGALTEEDGDTVQFVELIGPDGVAYTARYTMERQPDGSWRISACELRESRRVGA